jgi:protein SCO1
VKPSHRRTALGLLAVTLLFLGGCGASEKHFALHGQVMSKDAEAGQLMVKHGAIPGFMAAMTMPYPVKDAQTLTDVQPGDQIDADVVVQGDSYWLQHVVITDKSARGTITATQPHQLAAGDKVPDVPLTNQDGKTIHLNRFKGQAVLVTFIYTRCPLPTFCPLISSEFAAIHRELAKSPREYKETHLVSVSIDPSNDTPPVLRKYGLAYLENNPGGFAHWDFVTTDPADLKKLADAFGLQFYEQDNQIAHSMSTVLLARDGTVAQSWPGNEWKTSDVLASIRQAETANE